MNGRRHCVNWIRPAEIRPTVTARPRHANTESATAQRLIRDALEPTHINCNELTFAAARPWRGAEDMPYAAQIPFTFFPNVRNGDNRLSKSQSRFTSSTEDPQQGHEATAI